MAEQTAQGVVFRKNPKKWENKTFYSFKFDGQEGWYRLGEKDYEGVVEPGFEIKIGFEVDGRGNNQVVPGHIKLIKKGDPPAATGGNKRSGGGGAGADKMSKEEWAEKDLTIQYQSSRNSAIAHVLLLLKTESVKLPAKTKFAERQAAIDGLTDFYTAKFFIDIAGRDAVARSAGELEVQATLPDGDDVEPQEGEDPGSWDSNDDGGSESEWD